MKSECAENLMDTLEQQQSRYGVWASPAKNGSDSFESPEAQRRAHMNFYCP